MENNVDQKLEHGYRRGYAAGVFDVLANVAPFFSDDERQTIENWVRNELAVWISTTLDEAVLPPNFPVGTRPDAHGPWPA